MAAGIGFVKYQTAQESAALKMDLAKTQMVLKNRNEELIATEDNLANAQDAERKLKDQRDNLAAALAEAEQTIRRLEAQLEEAKKETGN